MKKHMYEYKRLETNNHIRVLILDPSQDASAPLQCSIKQHELGITAEPYECISYTWGSQILAHDIFCDDGSVVEITANLHSALSRFRSNSHARCLWADAVCINQADSEEKSRQIPLMPRIYRDASHVLVWLGSGMDGESETMQSLAQLEMLPDRFSFASRQDQGIPQRVDPQSPEAQESIRRFFQLPWFGRRWVVQEAVLNPDVVFYCGLTKISWPRLHLAIESLPDCIWNDTSGSKVRKSLQQLGDLWRAWSHLPQTVMNCELFDLLDSFHHLECQEDKDRIYALAGLASDVQTSTEPVPLRGYQEKMSLVPDYSLSDNEVFRLVALRRIQSGRAFTTLAYAGAVRLRNGSRALPSWVPDFRLSKLWRTMLEEPDSKYQPRIKLRYDGSLTLKGKVRTLRKRAFHTSFLNKWDSCAVKKIFPGPTDSEPRSMLQYVHDCLLWVHSLPELAHLEEENRTIALCDRLLNIAVKQGKERYEMNDSTSDLMLDDFNRLLPNNLKADIRDRRLRPLLISLLNEDSENKNLEGIMPYLSMLFKGLIGRCLFISKAISILGIGPGDLVAGDVIVRFAGVEQSLFFRPEDGKHQVLGDGLCTLLPPWVEHQFDDYEADIVLV